MRIALLTYSTKARGGVVHTLALAEALAAQGESVTVWALARGTDRQFFRPVDPRVTVRLVALAELAGETVGARIVRSIAQLRAHFTPEAYDIVHAQDCISANAVDRCIRTIHHLDAFSTPELVRCHERAIMAPYAHICVSAAVAGEVEKGWGIRPTVIANGIDAQRFAAARLGLSARAEWAAELGRYVLAVGGIEPRKGTDDLVEAMAIVQQARPELTLVVAGGETLFDYREYRDRVDNRIAELGLNFCMLGPVEHSRLPALMAQAAVFAFPSRKEGFGLAAMEAMAAGVPVVMRDLPVLREVFGTSAQFAHDVTGLAEQILLAHQAGQQDPRVDAGRALARRHTWRAAATAHRAFYRQQLAR